MTKLYKKYNANGDFIKSDTLENLIKEDYFVSKSIDITYKKRLPTGFNLKESDNYYFNYNLNDCNGYQYEISPAFYFRLKLEDKTQQIEKIAQKIIDSLEFKQVFEYNDIARKKSISLKEIIFKEFIDKKLIVNFRKV